AGGRTAGFGTHNTFGDRTTETERVAERHDGLTEQYILIGSEFDGGEFFTGLSLNLQERDIAAGGADDRFGLVFPAILQFELNAGRAMDNVEVGKYIAVLVNDNAGTEADGALAPGSAGPAVKLAKQIVVPVVIFNDGFSGDVDDARHR